MNMKATNLMEDSVDTVAQMTRQELREMIETIVEEKLLELLGDPNEGLPIHKTVRERLLRQKEAIAGGERGEPFEEVIRRLGLE
ncbi:MAG: hypothetical protein D6791_12885 [Chloroflexi bacterium]|nr:MAG: hypothetical protein D6791_12885 [Chloroflexota bacterium]